MKVSSYEVAHELAQQLQDSEEFRSFMAAKKKILADEGNHKMIRDFQHKQMEVQQAQLFQHEVSPEIQQDLERLYSLLSLNPMAREYLEAEFRISRLVNDVQKIIGEAIQEALPIGFEELDEPDSNPLA